MDKDNDIKIEEELNQTIADLNNLDNITINIDDTIIDLSGINSSMNYNSSLYSYGNVTINGSTGAVGSSGFFSNGNTILTGNNTGSLTQSSLRVNGGAEIDGDLKVKGVSILETLEKIEKRLCILRPDPEKLEHFTALKKAYEHYKTLEALCEIQSEEKE